MKNLYPVCKILLICLFMLTSVFQLQAQLPSSFQRADIVTGLSNATTFKFAPDGRIFIVDRYGELLIYNPNTNLTTSAGTLPVFHELEDGFLGLAFDPNFVTNNFVYLHFSPIAVVKNRVSRFTMNGDVLDLNSEVILLEWDTQRDEYFHAAGDMDFDSQGNLYIATGDNSNHSQYANLNENDENNSSENTSSNTNDLRGKILRITPQPNGTYSIPPGNLFSLGTDGTRPEIYVMGARNPYRIFVDKDHDDWLFWGEVGPDANEASTEGPEGRDEINLVKEAGNYGWPYFAAENIPYQNTYSNPNFFYDPLAPVNISRWNTGLENLPPAQPSWIDFFHRSYCSGPRYLYNSTLSDQQRLPSVFDGVYFYFDFNTSRIFAVQMDDEGNILSDEPFAPSVFPNSKDGFLDMQIGPDGFMYILAYGTGCCPQNSTGSGKLIKVSYTGEVTNSAPIVELSVDRTDGSLPLTVNFSSEGTTDADGDFPLSYSWDFNSDGIADSTEENPSFTYTSSGNINAQLVVEDGNGGRGVKNITIYAGNNKATFTYNSPPRGALVNWDDDISLDITVNDVEDGSTTTGIDCNNVNVVPALGHLNHFHDDLTITGCPQTINLKSEGHNIEGDADIFFVVGTNYQDAGGLTSFDQLILHPKRKEAEFYDLESGTTIIPNSDELEGGSEAIRVDADGFIVFEQRNLRNMTAVKYRVLSNGTGNSIELRTGSATGSLLATTQVPNTSGEWLNVQTAITDPGTTNDLYFVFKGSAGQSDIFDLNYVEFIGAGVSIDSTPPTVNDVLSISETEVTVEFSEYMDKTSAELPSNYAIDNNISISSAVLLEDNRTVVLTTSTLSNDTSYSIDVGAVQNESGLSLEPNSFIFSILGEIRINVGGPQTLVDGQTFIADRYASGGTLFTNEIPINGTSDDTLYQTERFGTYSYEIPVSIAGDYDIRLHFAEIFYGASSGGSAGGAGSRIFNVSIEGNPVLSNFDILSETAAATALTKELDNISVSDGFVSISFSSVTESPKVSGIEILSPDTFDGIVDTDANITITSPSNGWEVNQPFEVAFRVENWIISEEDTHLHYFVDGTMVDRYYDYEPIPIEGYSLGEHTIRVELFNADHTPTGIFDEVTVNISGNLSCNETPFPDSWVVHELEENPYVVLYTFADYDLDGDGLKDIVTGGWWYKNPGTAAGDWVKNTIGAPFSNVAHVYDFDGDGDMDLLGTTGQYQNAILVWAQNDGAGNFTVFENIPAGETTHSEPFLAGLAGGVYSIGGPYQMAINWNGAESNDGPVQMLTPTDDPTTGTWTLENISFDSSGEDIQAGDIDLDGDLDLFQGDVWLRNNGNNSWETFSTGITYGSTPDRAQLADFDRDGDLDAVVGQLSASGDTATQNEFSWFEAPTDPTQPWIRRILDTNIRGSLSVFAVDLDFDGDKDIVVGEWLGEHRLIAFENDLCGSGEFVQRILDDGGLDFEHHDGARVTDIDNDGDLDVISNGFRNDLIPRIYENTSELIIDGGPIANAGDDREVALSTEFTLNGSGSDPDGGEITSYLWNIQSSPEGDTASLSGADTSNVTIANAVEGTYVFRLTITDDEGETGIDEVLITVGASTIPNGNVTRINAGGPTFTADGNSWGADQNFNGGSAFINEIPIEGTTNQQLYQSERFGTSGSGNLIYEIPVANGEHDVNLHFAEIYFGLPGGGSDGGAGSRVFTIDVEGERIENYDIFVAAGGAATAVVESFTGINVTDESLTITLIPVTEFPKISGIELIVPVPVAEGAPVADAGEDQQIILPENSIVLLGNGTDADGGEVTYEWRQQSGPEATLNGVDIAELSVTNMVPGNYVFQLTVTDDEGEMDFDEVNVTVLPAGEILAVAEASPTTGSAPLEVIFTGSNSLGDIRSYLWDFKDGNTSTDANPSHVFATEGTYEVSLTVIDQGDNLSVTTITIVVSDMMGIFLEQNPPKDGIATIRVINQPDGLMMLGLNVHDVHGRLLNSYIPESIVVNEGRYEIPVHILKSGIYFFKIAMNQGKPITLKLLIRN